MPVAIIAVVVVLAAAVGFTVFRADAPEIAPDMNEEVTRPADEESTNGTEVEVEADVEASGSAATGLAPDVTDEEIPTDAFTSGMAEPTPEPLDTPVVGGVYNDGSYTVETSYFTPARTEHEMDVTLVVNDDIVTDATVLYDGGAPETGHHQRFDSAFKAAVIGQPLAGIYLSRTGGASLTSEAFNEAVDTIQQQAS